MMSALNQVIIARLEHRAVSTAFVDFYKSVVPINCDDIAHLGRWWANYLGPHSAMFDVAHYLLETKSPASWLLQFDNAVPEFINSQTRGNHGKQKKVHGLHGK